MNCLSVRTSSTLKNGLILRDMIPSREMLEAYFSELSHCDEGNERMWFFAGVAAFCHLQSPASDEWKKQHGFNEKGGQDD